MKARLAKLEALVSAKTIVEPVKPVEDKHDDHHHEEPKLLMISQEMFERQLNMLKRSAKFILENANVEEINKKEGTNAQTEKKIKDFLRHLNNLQLTFDNLLANKDKYNLSEATQKCIQEAESLKQQLDQLANSNWDVESLFIDRLRSRAAGC